MVVDVTTTAFAFEEFCEVETETTMGTDEFTMFEGGELTRFSAPSVIDAELEAATFCPLAYAEADTFPKKFCGPKSICCSEDFV